MKHDPNKIAELGALASRMLADSYKISHGNTEQHAELRDKIIRVIRKYQEKADVLDPYFHIEDIIIHDDPTLFISGKVKFKMGPSSNSYNWTLKYMMDFEGDFYEALKKCLNGTQLNFIRISTEYRSWAVSGYNIQVGYQFKL